MGEARRRGTYEARKAEGVIKREAIEHEARAARERRYEARKAAEAKGREDRAARIKENEGRPVMLKPRPGISTLMLGVALGYSVNPVSTIEALTNESI